MTFTIESGIPMPKRATVGRKGTEFPFADMDVGESFLMPCDISDEKAIVNWRRKLASARKRFESKSDYDISLRTAVVADERGTGVRVWRTA
jgi:hypothetical protein